MLSDICKCNLQTALHADISVVKMAGLNNSGPLFYKADGRLTARSREVSKPWDSGLDFSIVPKFACQIS